MSNDYEKATQFRLGDTSSGWGEIFIHDLVVNDPSVLGLGELVVKDRERIQQGAGRLDLLLQDTPPTARYTVEIQLGETNPSHIIRTIEYWDRERRRYPQYEHVAVIVAEEITSRFFNVIALFNQHIPLIAIKMTALDLVGKRTVLFTKVLDYASSAVEEEEAEYQPESRQNWEERSSPASVAITDAVLAIAKTIDPSIVLKLNRANIVLKIGTQRERLLTFWPQKKAVKMSLPGLQSSVVEEKLDSANIDYEGYDERRRRYVLRLLPSTLPQRQELLRELIEIVYKQAKDLPAGGSDD
jgi:hypothetical protein